MSFFDEYEILLEVARTSGIRAVPDLKLNLKDGPPSPDQLNQFIKACHTGFAEAQRQIVTLLRQVKDDPTIDADEKTYRTLLLRRVADHMAWSLFALEGHVVRRLALHDDPPVLDLQTISLALQEAEIRNSESLLTFTLVADLTTFFHVADLITIDFRVAKPRVVFTELKSGKVNDLLLENLADYTPQESSLEQIDNDPNIQPEHRKQARRMLRQRIRQAQVDEVITKDEGTDIRFKVPIKIHHEYIETSSWGDILALLCEKAEQSGIAGGLGGWCIHIGVATGDDLVQSQRRASEALNQAIQIQLNQNPPGIKKTAAELSSKYGIAPEDQIMPFNLLNLNLGVITGEPFTMWPVRPDLMRRIVERTISIGVGFDLAAFIWLGNEAGVPVRVATHKETGRATSFLGSRAVPRWGNRAVVIEWPSGPVTLGGGMLSRFLVNLVKPESFLVGARRIEEMEQDNNPRGGLRSDG